MHLAIDLGNKCTFLAGWENGKLTTDYCIRVRIPGMTRFIFNTAESFLDREGMQEYFSHLYREYILPSRMIVESAAISYPAILDLNTHRMILDVLEEVMELPEVIIVPQPLALVNGYNLHNPLRPLSGDIMVIQPDESLDFISIMNDGRVILEKHVAGSVANVRKEAESIGFYSNAGWNLDMVLWENDISYTPILEELLNSLPEKVNIMGVGNLQSISVDGLSRLLAQDAPFYNMNFIFPYEIYIEKKNPNQKDNELVKIPFDTTNLELRCGAGYKLLTLDSSGIYNLADDPERINVRFYQSEAGIASKKRLLHIPDANLVFEIDSLKSDLPARINIYLDLAAASLVFDLKPEKAEPHQLAPLDFQNRLLGLHSKIYDIIKTTDQHSLTYEIEKHMLARSSAIKNLPSQIELTLLRLNSILSLWNDK
ncbi:MAG: hypothetical protein PHF24_04600 [Syntrophomonas sp.]|nr:hypothetical protein [Syntrophomonas sp.]